MTDYFTEYDLTIKEYFLIKQKIIKNHTSHYPILNELLGFQYYLNKRFSEFYSTLDKSDLKKHISSLSIHLLFAYNTQSLQSVLNDLEHDKIHQAAVNMRTVYESIPKMYYISLFPEEINLIMVHEHITGMPFEKVLKELQGEECVAYLDGQKLNFESKDELDIFNKKYSPYGFIKTLYSKKHRELIEKLYYKFSNSTHPNITRNKTSVSYEPKNTELFFELLESLSYFNIQAYFEGNTKFLVELGVHQEIINFLNGKAKQLQTFIKEVYFFPDKESLEKKIKTTITTLNDS